ncbi:hypothetical protein [Pseudonocardia sp. GCM10023141]|uniref:hypothetical protein n=1 Tax=Pseudonocardia sp. GCM10023141 TaxID=3252653 RepID=UPI0036187B59
MQTPIAELLSPITSALEADGYSAHVTEGPGTLEMRIIAGAGVCADCLSPRSVVEPMINRLLQNGGITRKVTLIYPDTDPGQPKDVTP